MTNKYSTFQCPFCKILIAGNQDGITNIHLITDKNYENTIINASWEKSDTFFTKEKEQIQNYFAGKLKEFKIKLNISGTSFQKEVWSALRTIDYGNTCSYGDIAKIINNKKAARAVGMACNKNPIPLVIPCHRIIGANGKMTGFAPGIALKKQLLELEAVNKINNQLIYSYQKEQL